MDLLIIIPVIIAIAIVLMSAIKILNEYERLVIFRLGRLVGAKGPGLVLIVPIIDRTRKVDLRVVTIDVPRQTVITKDNVTISVDAIIYYKVIDAESAITQVENYKFATSMLSKTTLRDELGHMELDDILTKTDEINKEIQELLDASTDPWGIKVTRVALREITIDENIRRAIAKQAEAEREKRGRIILSEGEFESAEKMRDAAKLYQEIPLGIKLRELQTLTEIAREKNLIVVSSSTEIGEIAAITRAITDKSKPPK
ncbi:MAG: slipin family protein [Methanobacteriaceae archaeon]|jgi:regulator of protease activity HflC (stomatin/prohibitin superfamily)